MLCVIKASNHGKSSSDPAVVARLAAVPAITRAQITRVGKLQQTTIAWSDGTKSEAWTELTDGLMVLEKTNQGVSSFYEFRKGSILRNPFFPVILDVDEASLKWINPNTFTGEVQHDGLDTLHYQKSVTIPDSIPARNVLYQAWTDPKTHELLALDDGDSLYQLTISVPPPKTALNLPPRFQAELLHYEAAYAKPVHL